MNWEVTSSQENSMKKDYELKADIGQKACVG